ncbi:MAG: hypothetical protein NWF01_10805 [Candidatus Bathyarchaeota archaeon]|nr:hypothetical protein [Candidatus Bathyarchaeota archaeon]
MKNKQNTKQQSRGWVPEELKISSLQQTKNPKIPITGVRLGLLIFAMGFAGAFLGGLDTALGLGLLSGVDPHVFVILLVVCITVVAITVILSHNKKRNTKT